MSRLQAAIAALCLMFVGCRDNGSSGDDDDDVGVDAQTGGTRIQDVQSESMVVDTPVDLRGVVVVAIDTYGGRTGNFYVMDAAGGPFSGVLVYGAPTDQVADLEVGDLVDVLGAKKDEFSLEDDDATVTELVPASDGSLSVAKVGDGVVPEPHVLDALVLGQMNDEAREAEYEKWEGVLIRVNNVTALGSPRQIGSSDPTFRGFGITGRFEVDSTLTEIPEDLVVGGDCLASVTGMGDYFYEYKVLPRVTADIVQDGTGCPAPESACEDDLDNDANGYVDCEDHACQTIPACQSSATVVQVQNGTIATDTQISLNNVVVTAITSNGRHLWVADSADAAPYNGVYVYRGNQTALSGITIGTRVNVTGKVIEYNNSTGTETLTEISENVSVTAVAGAPLETPVPAVFAVADTLIAAGEMYEGVFVELQNVRVISDANSFGVREFGAETPRVVTFESDDDIAPLTGASGTCFASIKGIWSYQVFDDRWAILPLANGATTGGTCL